IGVLLVSRIDLHLSRIEPLLLTRERVPGGERGVSRRQPGGRGDDPQGLLPGEGLLAELVPALVELALVPVGPFPRDVVRRMGRAGGVIDEKWLVRRLGLLIAEPADRPFGEVVREVVILLPGAPDDRVVLGEDRVVLAGLAAEEAVEVVEAQPRRPAIER